MKGAYELRQQEIEYELQHKSKSCNKKLDLEKCLYSEQELRTILLQHREDDGYLLGHQNRLCTSSPIKEISFQNHAWQDLFAPLLFEFHGKRHFMEFYLELQNAIFKKRCQSWKQAF